MTDQYRSAASLIVLKTVEGSEAYQLLLLHKPRKKDAWQLPQGGVEAGETIEQAALRELHEEAGITNAQVLGKSERVYQYDFPPSYRRFRPDNICGQKIEYIFTIVPPEIQVNVDNAEIDSYMWIDIRELSKYVKRKEYIELAEHLYEEAVTLARQSEKEEKIEKEE